jgi:hypothetical protein
MRWQTDGHIIPFVSSPRAAYALVNKYNLCFAPSKYVVCVCLWDEAVGLHYKATPAVSIGTRPRLVVRFLFEFEM